MQRYRNGERKETDNHDLIHLLLILDNYCRWVNDSCLMFWIIQVPLHINHYLLSQGYPSSVPVSTLGKLSSLFITFLGLPIFLLYSCLAGGFLARHLQSFYGRISCCQNLDSTNSGNLGKALPIKSAARVPLWLCALLLIIYLLLGSVWVSQYHKVSFIDGLYYSFALLCTIGVALPGSPHTSTEDPLSIVMTSLYILTGVALMAMCVHLLHHDISSLLRSLSSSPEASWQLPVSRESSLETSITSFQTPLQLTSWGETSGLHPSEEERGATHSEVQLPSEQIQLATVLNELDLRSIDPETAAELLDQIQSGSSMEPILARLKELCARGHRVPGRGEKMVTFQEDLKVMHAFDNTSV